MVVLFFFQPTPCRRCDMDIHVHE